MIQYTENLKLTFKDFKVYYHEEHTRTGQAKKYGVVLRNMRSTCAHEILASVAVARDILHGTCSISVHVHVLSTCIKYMYIPGATK